MNEERCRCNDPLVAELAQQRRLQAPVESHHEREIGNRFLSTGRAFYKPIRYNLDESEVPPDFVLLDCERSDVRIEVFG